MAKVNRKSNFNKARIENGLKRGLILGGQLVAQRAAGKAPVDKGRLKRSIAEGQPQRIAVLAFRISVGTNVEYAAIQEYGIGVRPQPYLGPALKESIADVKRLIAINLRAAFQ